ncbi:MAG TPA: WD40 repeat domain-containing protein, partial [Gemmataceae bacterium]|nr:WD40 repeat domain-containing protein [Gemmataceae bacterium]
MDAVRPAFLLFGIVASAFITANCFADPPRNRFDIYGQPLPEGAAARLGHVKFGLRGTPMAVAWSPDGKKLAAVSNTEPYLHIWEWPSGKTLIEKRLPEVHFGSLLFSPDGQFLFWSDGYVHDHISRLWRVQDGSEISLPQSIRGRSGSASFSHDSKRLAFAERERDVVEWILGEETATAYKGTNAPDKAIVFTKEDNELLIATSVNDYVAAKNASKGTELLRLESEDVFHRSLAFAPNGKWL